MERIKLGDRLRISNPTKGVGWEVAGTGEGGAAWTTHIAKLWAGLRLKIPRIFLFASSLLPLRVSYLLPL